MSSDINTLLNEESTKLKTNAEAIAQVYYEYHGKHDDGNSPADALPYGFSEVIAV